MLPRTGSSIDSSSELVSELKALNVSGAALGDIDERRIRSVAESINDVYKHVDAIVSNPYVNLSDPTYASAVTYYRAKYLRQKRCLAAYLSWRLQRCSSAWWQARDDLISEMMTDAERQHAEEFDDTLVQYMSSFPVMLDLRSFSWRPPSLQQLEVRGLKDHRFVSVTSGETQSIYAGKQILLNFEEAEPLLQQGLVELVEH